MRTATWPWQKLSLAMARKDIGLLETTAAAETLSVIPGLAEAMEALIQQGQGKDNCTVFSAR